MKENSSVLYSEYIIDGVKMDSTPARMLMECMPPDRRKTVAASAGGVVMDETKDPVPGHTKTDSSMIYEYAQSIRASNSGERGFQSGYPSFYTRLRIASAVIGSLWKKGHFGLGNLHIGLRWLWDATPLGNMAAFYTSSEAAGEYIYDLGITLDDFSLEETDGECLFEASILKASQGMQDESDEGVMSGDGGHDRIWMSDERACPDKTDSKGGSRLIYIPFDTCPHRLGGSLLEQSTGPLNDRSPEIQDPDYFIDCYEVVRELVEDNVVMAGITVGDGGLMTAAGKLCRHSGATLDLAGVMSSYMESDAVKILFAEIPGILIQIHDSDYDYVDGQLLLQDIAYYPVGRPGRKDGRIMVSGNMRSDVASILASLMYGQGTSEGED